MRIRDFPLYARAFFDRFLVKKFHVHTEKVFVFSRPAIFLLQLFFRVKVCVSSFHFLPSWKFRWPEKFSIEQTLPHGTKILVSRTETAFFATQLTHSGFQNRFSRKIQIFFKKYYFFIYYSDKEYVHQI